MDGGNVGDDVVDKKEFGGESRLARWAKKIIRGMSARNTIKTMKSWSPNSTMCQIGEIRSLWRPVSYPMTKLHDLDAVKNIISGRTAPSGKCITNFLREGETASGWDLVAKASLQIGCRNPSLGPVFLQS